VTARRHIEREDVSRCVICDAVLDEKRRGGWNKQRRYCVACVCQIGGYAAHKVRHPGVDAMDHAKRGLPIPERADDRTPLSALEEISRSEYIARAVRGLPARERTVVAMRFSDPAYTLEEVGRKLKVSRARVSQLEARALAKLRFSLRELREKGDKA